MTDEVLERLKRLEQLVQSESNIKTVSTDFPQDAYTHLQKRVSDLENKVTTHRLIIQDLQSDCTFAKIAGRKSGGMLTNHPFARTAQHGFAVPLVFYKVLLNTAFSNPQKSVSCTT